MLSNSPLQGYSARMSGAGEGVMGGSGLARLGFSEEKVCILRVAKIRLTDWKDFCEGLHHFASCDGESYIS